MLEPVKEKLHVRSLSFWMLAYASFLFGFGILTRKPSGILFGLMALFLFALLVKRAFGWSPDPNARRNFLLFASAVFIGGALGTVLIDTATVALLFQLGRCPAVASIICP